MVLEIVYGIIFSLKIPILWQLALYCEFDDKIYLCSWCLFFLGLSIPKKSTEQRVWIGVISDILLSLCYNSPYVIGLNCFLLSMICFGFSLGKFYNYRNYFFYSGSLIGCLIGAFCAYTNSWLTIFNLILSLLIFFSFLQTFAHYWFSKCQKTRRKNILTHSLIELEDYSQYPAHKTGVIVVITNLFVSSVLMSLFLFVIPLLLSDSRSIFYIYLVYGVFNVFNK